MVLKWVHGGGSKLFTACGQRPHACPVKQMESQRSWFHWDLPRSRQRRKKGNPRFTQMVKVTFCLHICQAAVHRTGLLKIWHPVIQWGEHAPISLGTYMPLCAQAPQEVMRNWGGEMDSLRHSGHLEGFLKSCLPVNSNPQLRQVAGTLFRILSDFWRDRST